MDHCPTSQLQQIGETAVADFDARIAKIPQDLSAAFQIEAMRLEDQLLIIYRLVALAARDQENLDKVSALWAFMVGICDSFGSRLAKLNEEHPTCGANIYYDGLLDLRNKCRRLQEMHS